MAREDLEAVQGRYPVIVVNDTWRLATWADVLYACDHKWWRKHGGVPEFAGLKITISNSQPYTDEWPAVKIVENTGTEGLGLSLHGVRTGRNSGYQAINLAVHFGARRIVLLGYDMKAAPDGRTHWFGDHADWPTAPAIFANTFLPHFDKLAVELGKAGVEVLNASRETALETFKRVKLEEILSADRL